MKRLKFRFQSRKRKKEEKETTVKEVSVKKAEIEEAVVADTKKDLDPVLIREAVEVEEEETLSQNLALEAVLPQVIADVQKEKEADNYGNGKY